MESRLFYPHTSWTVPPSLGSTSMERGDLRLLRNDRVGDRHRNDGSDPVNRRRCDRSYNGHRGQRAVLFLLDPFWLAIIFGRRPGTDASQIPPSQSSVPFLIGTGLILTKPACLSHFAVSETV